MVGIAFLLLLSVQFVSGRKCTLDWQQYEQSCYGFMKRPLLNWAAASTHCAKRYKARLAEINNTGLNNWLHEQFLNEANQNFHIWIGATSKFTKGELMWIPSGKPVLPYVNWLPSEPDNPETKKCALLHQGEPGAQYGWKSEDCNTEYPVICVKPLIKDLPMCEFHFVKEGDICFSLRSETFNWRSAVAKCKSMGAEILETKNTFINTWTGDLLQSFAPRNFSSIWIGGSSLFTGGNWVWLKSHRPMQSFVNFSPGEPQESKQDNGLLMYVKTGKWEAAKRKTKKSMFFCEKHI